MANLEESSGLGSSAHVIASNDDLLLEVLLHLPIKSLFQFKSVSKRWLSLITVPHFTQRITLRSNPISALYLHCHSRDTGRFYDFVPLDPLHTRAIFRSLTFVHCPRGIEILQSCNGLLCCCSVGESQNYIYNPTTKQFTTLPPLNNRAVMSFLGVNLAFDINLAFDPSKSPFYTVVCIQRSVPSFNSCQIEVYSSETGRWRVSGAQFTAPISVNFQGGVYWNGAIHWASLMDSGMYFDLNDELVREMPMPPLPHDYDERKVTYFGESCGHLHLVEICLDSASQFNIYEMKRDRSNWFVKFQVDLNGVAYSHLDTKLESCNTYPYKILSVVRGAKEEDCLLFMLVSGQVIRYNFRRNTHHVICISRKSMNLLQPISMRTEIERDRSGWLVCEISS